MDPIVAPVDQGGTPPSVPVDPGQGAGVIPGSTPETPMYELPDGRKVTGEELSREWKDNFLPDYTKKSQELAKLNKTNS